MTSRVGSESQNLRKNENSPLGFLFVQEAYNMPIGF